MNDDAAAGLFHRGENGVEVERHEAAQIDDLGVDAGFFSRRLRDIDHRAVAEDGDGAAGAPDNRLAERHGEVTVGDFSQFVFRPGLDRAVVMAVERAVIEALGFKEDNRVRILDRGDEQALGVIGV